MTWPLVGYTTCPRCRRNIKGVIHDCRNAGQAVSGAQAPAVDAALERARGVQGRDEPRRAPREPVTLETASQARHGDPQTSHDAAVSLLDLPRSRAAVLQVLEADGPMCDENLVAVYRGWANEGRVPHQSPSGVRTRRSELVDAGLVEKSGERVESAVSGRWMTVWRSRLSDERRPR